MPQYARPTHLAEALALRAAGYGVLAGGTDLYPAAGAELAGDVIDITGLDDLQGIRAQAGLRIGAATSWTAIAEARLPLALRALQQSAVVVGGRQIQNAGTIGGNLCNASPAADGIPPLLVLQAEVEIASARGIRRMALQDFLTGPRRVDLRVGELLTAILIPEAALAGRSGFAKLGARSHLVISIAMVAVRIVAEGGHIRQAFAAVGACSATAQRLPLVEAALAGGQVAGAADRIRPEQLEALTPIDDIRATAAYRREAALELLRRTVAEVAG
jgi:CO/xanthine dehydrogenase FAD-binding subunit